MPSIPFLQRTFLQRLLLLACVACSVCCIPLVGGLTAAADEKTSAAATQASGAESGVKQILMIAGGPSHAYGAHEHYAGLRVLQDAIETSEQPVRVTVVRGWPSDPEQLAAADSIVIYSDGGGGHPALPHLQQLTEQLDRGCGLVCLHYAVEVPPGEAGDIWKNYLGGYFEIHWSVNPHWTAHFETLPQHPITRGVSPFQSHDEWYFHMRFRDQMEGVTPILQAVAPIETMRRPDGPHSGNAAVRRSVAAGEPQTVGWAYERGDGGRSFGFTGGHFHWNWGVVDFRRTVANAILWTAGLEIADEGNPAKTLSAESLLENQDGDPPADLDLDAIREQFQLTGHAPSAETPTELLAASPVITTQTAGHAVALTADIRDQSDLYLVVGDGGDGLSCDWANWVNPRISGPAGELSLVELGWSRASTDWGTVRANANVQGEPPVVDGQAVTEPMIGCHATSLIHFQIPAGYDTLQVTGALDRGGASQSGGTATSVQFAIYAGGRPRLAEVNAQLGQRQRDAVLSTASLQAAPGLSITLSAAEPTVRNLTNIDIDDRGRVWVVDVMNYRGHQGTRIEGDRILILEDTDHDGVMDKETVFYQGTDIDSAMGLCILGNEVIVTASPYVWRLIDDDGDDVADRKIAMFTETGDHQHDHSAHSFIFGPDGKLYWNFGNTGKQVKDAEGNLVVDIHGRPVVDNGRPFWGGMVFRCDRDGSNLEVIGHNFRNNWETAIDSFGSLWQSDNDDDGNRGTRINFVMEHGNYGYLDQRTGAMWRVPRIDPEETIPQRHWHLNDPGVVPNLLQTGAGSPCGMCVYEGELLPAVFQNQMLHCEPGENTLRAYPVEVAGAGYRGQIVPVLSSPHDGWVRPVDVAVAPDGSLFVTDWYGPGLGGHQQGDTERGRLYRIAPPDHPYRVPSFDYRTPEGAVEALRSPTQAVRYKAWMSLKAMGQTAVPALETLYTDANPRMRARALWLLGQLETDGADWARRALQDEDADIRLTAVRLIRQLGLSATEELAGLVGDPEPRVRRELLVSLRFDTSERMPSMWADLAQQYDGKDRWYLEALGIGGDLRSAECYQAFAAAVGDDWQRPPYVDITWRMQTPLAAERLCQLILDAGDDLASTNRYFRALDLYPPAMIAKPMAQAFLAESQLQQRWQLDSRPRDAVVVRVLERMSDDAVPWTETLRAVLRRHALHQQGTPEFLRLANRYPIGELETPLLQMVDRPGDDSDAVAALELLLRSKQGRESIGRSIAGDRAELAESSQAESGQTGQPPAVLARRLALLGLSTDAAAVDLLQQVLVDQQLSYDLRSQAVRGLARSTLGGQRLVGLASSDQLPDDCRLLAAGLLAKNEDQSVRQSAAAVLPAALQDAGRPLPAIDDLVRLSGDVQRGQQLFHGRATCGQCHVVDGQGKAVGPDLSEIGNKLSAEAMYVSILDPSAGISHNYETYVALLDSGQVVSGVLVSQTEDEVILRTAEAIERRLPVDQIVEIKKSDKSIMPDGLHLLVDVQGLADVVQYMISLKK